MSIKSIVLAAAAVAVTATAGAADSYFQKGRTLDAGTVLELGLVTADNNGVVEIYDFHTGEQGALLGAEMVNAGANTDVRVNTVLPAKRDVIAVLKVDGQVAAQKEFIVN
ncbi:hypothetical protein [Yoonia sp. SS1-5]|uniref:Uncharacterized protein n=1 Tax=Yoonia rhodophyticola TaxID=3137370 RepID=A0AAN0NJK1_9RHOB